MLDQGIEMPVIQLDELEIGSTPIRGVLRYGIQRKTAETPDSQSSSNADSSASAESTQRDDSIHHGAGHRYSETGPIGSHSTNEIPHVT
uniref:Uncharacterized protein n=1 Tax=Caenorhabditis japonica TaxID=281687 RepID=A0A8R1IT02_CAEJA